MPHYTKKYDNIPDVLKGDVDVGVLQGDVLEPALGPNVKFNFFHCSLRIKVFE